MAPPPASRAVQPVLHPGALLAGRYRLVRPVQAASPGAHGPALLWLAQDEVLARPVAAKVLTAGGRRASTARAFLQAAADAGSVSSPVLARVYDAALEQRPAERSGRPAGEIDVAYVISEWIDGPRLAEVLAQDGPYDPLAATVLATTLAEGLAAAHDLGVVHGRVHPGNVLLSSSGAVKLTDLAVAATLPEGAVPAGRADDPDPAEADVRDLAAVLYALLTARWPGAATPQPSGGVPPAPVLRGGDDRRGDDRRGRQTSPRQVRAGVPRALDAAVTRALDPAARRVSPPLTTPECLSDAVEAAVRHDGPRRPAGAAAAPSVPRWLSRSVPALAVVALLVVIGVSSYGFGRDLGELPPPDDAAVALVSPAPQPSAAAAGEPVDLAGVQVRDFDPDGDGGERPGSVANALDGDLGTFWETERYDSAAFGGLKGGVGLLLDLGEPVPLTRVEVVVPRAGVTVELRGASAPSPDAAAYTVLAAGRADGERLVLTPPEGAGPRFVLLWVTGLAEDGGRFSAGISEVVLTRRPA